MKEEKIGKKIRYLDRRFEYVRRRAPKSWSGLTTWPKSRATHCAEAQVRYVQGIPFENVRSHDPFGSVVGFKDSGTWKFYLQKRKLLSQTVGHGTDNTLMVIEAREVWLNGGGFFRTVTRRRR